MVESWVGMHMLGEGVQVHVSRSVHGFYSKNKGSINLKKKETRNVNFKSMETLLNKICTLRDF